MFGGRGGGAEENLQDHRNPLPSIKPGRLSDPPGKSSFDHIKESQ